MEKEILSALIASGTLFLLLIIRDVLFPLFTEKKKKKEKIRTICEKYAHPLARDSISLFYRLREIIDDKRNMYLRSDSLNNRFNIYKFNSTIYRLACLIGWLRALKLEQSYLLHPPVPSDFKINDIILKLEEALADGPHIEKDIIIKLCKLWGIKIPDNEERLKRICIITDEVRNKYSSKNHPDFNMESIDENKKIEILTTISKKISGILECKEISSAIISETKDRASKILSPKQALVFRDMQNAIGDVMIKEVAVSERRFEVIGYSEFNEMLTNKNCWIKELKNIFLDVDFNVRDDSDYRTLQIENIMKACANIVLAINNIALDIPPIPKKNIQDISDYIQANQ